MAKVVFVHQPSYAGFPDGEPQIIQIDESEVERLAAIRDGGHFNGVEWVYSVGWYHEYPSVAAARADYPDAL